MNRDRAEQVIAYALAIAGQKDEYVERMLGPIHLIKYAYLADMAYGEKHEGETYTGTRWQFYHYGPWSLELCNLIPAAAASHGAQVRTFESSYDKDFIRWVLQDDQLVAELEKTLPWEVCRAIKRAVLKFGKDTKELLHHVYTTKPMLRAAPHEMLDLKPESSEETKAPEGVPATAATLTGKQTKRWEQKVAAFRERLAAPKAPSKKLVQPTQTPRYDEVFFQGQAWLDAAEGEPLKPAEREIVVDDPVWTSTTRRDPEIP